MLNIGKPMTLIYELDLNSYDYFFFNWKPIFKMGILPRGIPFLIIINDGTIPNTIKSGPPKHEKNVKFFLG